MDQLKRSCWRIAAIGIASTVVSTAVMSLIWKRQSFFALLGLFLLVSGGYTVLPWNSPIRKAISIGIFVGLILATGMFYLNLLGTPH
jgi:hypothetical protein